MLLRVHERACAGRTHLDPEERLVVSRKLTLAHPHLICDAISSAKRGLRRATSTRRLSVWLLTEWGVREGAHRGFVMTAVGSRLRSGHAFEHATVDVRGLRAVETLLHGASNAPGPAGWSHRGPEW